MKPGFSFRVIVAFAVTVLTGCGADAPSRPIGEGWVLERVTGGTHVGIHSSLTTTSDGTVHIAYYDEPGKRIFYARRLAADQWEHTQLDTIGWYGRSPVIESAPGDTLHLAYKDIYHDDLRYARYDGQHWAYERIDPYQSYGGSPVILLRPDGVHLLDLNIEMDSICYWQGSLFNWTSNGRVRISRTVSSFDFAVGPIGYTLAIFRESYSYWTQTSESSELLLSTAPDPDGPWSQTVLTVIAGHPLSSPVLEFDGDGILHVVYLDNNGSLHDISAGFIDNTSVRGAIRLQEGLAGDLWLLYTRGEGLTLAHFTPGGTWSRVTVIGDLNAEGQYGLHVAADGTIHISAYSKSLQELLYGRWEGTP